VNETIAAEPVIKTETAPSTAGMTTKVVKGSLWTVAGQVHRGLLPARSANKPDDPTAADTFPQTHA
jgi:hypothetical protein